MVFESGRRAPPPLLPFGRQWDLIGGIGGFETLVTGASMCASMADAPAAAAAISDMREPSGVSVCGVYTRVFLSPKLFFYFDLTPSLLKLYRNRRGGRGTPLRTIIMTSVCSLVCSP